MFASIRRWVAHPAAGTVGVLLLLCAYFSWATIREERPEGVEGARQVVARAIASTPANARFAVVGQSGADEEVFVKAAVEALKAAGRSVATSVNGSPSDVMAALRTASAGAGPMMTVHSAGTASWGIWTSLQSGGVISGHMQPEAGRRSAFLSPSNIRNVTDQISVIAIIAVGMTMVIITGGIDLSVGSLVAFAAVLAATLIRSGGGAHAGAGVLFGAGLAAVIASGLVGGVSGVMVTRFSIPPFIATLAMMQVASGLAFIVARGQTIYDAPASFTALGRGELIPGIPNPVLVMAAAFAAAHVLLTRTAVGRRIYALGGNLEAARLSGVPVNPILLLVYVISGAAAGLGGVVVASQLRAGAPTYGAMYELYVIAAVVVGGTSLSGGIGSVLLTLVGALIIGVIRNGMNLMDVEPYTQKVVLGLVILGAVLLDVARRRRSKQI